ncbi:MAG: phosphatase [Legionellaceae bacterium]
MKYIPCLLLLVSPFIQADSIGRYMNIANNIPKMEMKADPQAQAWARSARNILNLTTESIAETLTLTNTTAAQQGTPFFCLPAQITLNSAMLNALIQQTYREISSQESDKDTMSVSEIALLGVRKKYPCSPTPDPHTMMHIETNLSSD